EKGPPQRVRGGPFSVGCCCSATPACVLGVFGVPHGGGQRGDRVRRSVDVVRLDFGVGTPVDPAEQAPGRSMYLSGLAFEDALLFLVAHRVSFSFFRLIHLRSSRRATRPFSAARSSRFCAAGREMPRFSPTVVADRARPSQPSASSSARSDSEIGSTPSTAAACTSASVGSSACWPNNGTTTGSGEASNTSSTCSAGAVVTGRGPYIADAVSLSSSSAGYSAIHSVGHF